MRWRITMLRGAAVILLRVADGRWAAERPEIASHRGLCARLAEPQPTFFRKLAAP